MFTRARGNRDVRQRYTHIHQRERSFGGIRLTPEPWLTVKKEYPILVQYYNIIMMFAGNLPSVRFLVSMLLMDGHAESH